MKSILTKAVRAGDEVMALHLSEKERSRLRGMIRRPRSRKQYYRARALLALDEGQPIEAVARTAKVGVERVEAWIEGFERLRLAYLAESDGPRPRSGQDEDDEALAMG
jgi:hypothetical protein